MSTSMDWFMKLVRVAGASFPGASSLVQLQSEIDSQAMAKRLEELSDICPDTRIPQKADPGIGEVKHISFPEFSAVDKGDQVTPFWLSEPLGELRPVENV